MPQKIIALMDGTCPIDKHRLVKWMQQGDLRTRAAVYELTRQAWNRIQPGITMEEQGNFMASYLLECLMTNPQSKDDYLHSGFSAGWELAAWLKHLAGNPEFKTIIQIVAERLTTAYLSSDSETRNRIETGALEHILEMPALRQFFVSWEKNQELAEAYRLCLDWGVAHENAEWNRG